MSIGQEIFKAVMQAAAVAIGVGLGWWLNGRSQTAAKVVQARADWASAAETCMGSVDSLIASTGRGVNPDAPAASQYAADRTARERQHADSVGALRAATVRLALVDRTMRKQDIMPVEDAIVGIRFYETGARVDVQNARKQVRSAVDRWTSKRRPA